MNNLIWVVVANGSLARILAAKNSHGLVEIETLNHPETRLHGRDLVTSASGRAHDRMGAGGHSLQGQQPQRLEAQHFAELLSQRLDHAHRSGTFSKLYLIASPAFLGLMRGLMHSLTQDSIAFSLDKDVTDKNPDEIRKYLPHVL